MAGFPNCVGVVDGTHIRILSPSMAVEREYINRKNYHSINVQCKVLLTLILNIKKF